MNAKKGLPSYPLVRAIIKIDGEKISSSEGIVHPNNTIGDYPPTQKAFLLRLGVEASQRVSLLLAKGIIRKDVEKVVVEFREGLSADNSTMLDEFEIPIDKNANR